METIHVKFDELVAMASECNNSGLSVNCSNFQDLLAEMNDILSQQDLDNLFDPLYEEYHAQRTPEVSDNSAANTLDTEDTPSSSSIIVHKEAAKLDGSTIMHSFENLDFKEAKSSLNYQDPSNMHEFHQQPRYTDKYQARPTEKHLKEVKRIFRYLRQSINMGLWYLKDFGFDLISYSDADHVGCHDDYKSTSGGI
ncbi:hypothetical protein Tco_0283196 [Tanacetum coccineum]